MKANYHLATAFLISILLGACSFSGLSGSSSFACKAPDGVTCNSVSGVYANSIENNLPSQQKKEKEKIKQDKESSNADEERPRAIRTSMTIPGGPGPDGSTDLMPLRTQPKVVRIWVAPWTDADNDMHDQSYTYMVINDGRWLIERSRDKIRAKYAPGPAANTKTSSFGSVHTAVDQKEINP